MKNMIKIDEFSKVNLRLGKIKSKDNSGIKISCNAEIFNSNIHLNAKEGDEVIISSMGEKLVVPVVNRDIPLVPDKKAGEGWKIS
jgi:hypothetical protein